MKVQVVALAAIMISSSSFAVEEHNLSIKKGGKPATEKTIKFNKEFADTLNFKDVGTRNMCLCVLFGFA